MNENKRDLDAIEAIGQVDSDVVPVTSENQLTKEAENNNIAVNISRCGAPVHSVWGYPFTESNVHSHSMPHHAVCKHCKQSVQHHQTLAVKNHLKKCRQFKKIMLDTAIVDRPDWWNDTKGQSASSSKASPSSKTDSHPSASSAVQTPGFSPPAPAKKTPAPGKKLRLRQKTCEN